jgi:YggT family protein
MIPLLTAVFWILGQLLGLLVIVIIANAILSWLVAFDIVNLRNRFAWSVAHFLEAVTRPVMRPFQKIIPPLGGIDVSPIVVILLIYAVKDILLPPLYATLVGLLGA